MNKITPVLSTLLLALAGNVSAEKYDDMHKQLDIMSNIIKSSMSEQQGRSRSRMSSVDSVYLKGQGVVFTIKAKAFGNNWGNYDFDFVISGLPEIPQAPAFPEIGEHTIIDSETREAMNDTIADAMQEYEQAREALNYDRESMSELAEQQRNLSYKVRDLEREQRDLNYQISRADKSSKAELAAEIEQLKAKQAEIEKLRSTLSHKAAELKKQKHIKQQQQEKERQQYYQSLTASLVESFCLYGNGLRAVPKNESVSLIIKAAGNKEGNRYKDMIYVFNKNDIMNCAIDKITTKNLLDKGQGYQF